MLYGNLYPRPEQDGINMRAGIGGAMFGVGMPAPNLGGVNPGVAVESSQLAVSQSAVTVR